MFCSNCGKQMPENGRFCPYCGRDLSVPVQPAVPAYVPQRPLHPPLKQRFNVASMPALVLCGIMGILLFYNILKNAHSLWPMFRYSMYDMIDYFLRFLIPAGGSVAFLAFTASIIFPLRKGRKKWMLAMLSVSYLFAILPEVLSWMNIGIFPPIRGNRTVSTILFFFTFELLLIYGIIKNKKTEKFAGGLIVIGFLNAVMVFFMDYERYITYGVVRYFLDISILNPSFWFCILLFLFPILSRTVLEKKEITSPLVSAVSES